VQVQVLRCQGCGAAVSYDAKVQAPRCAFCDSVMALEAPQDPLEEPEAFLPFQVTPGEARVALKRWLGSLGWFRPDDLRSESRVETLRPLVWVGWVFDVETLASWTADSNQGSHRSSWAPHSGQVEVDFQNVLVSASRGLTEPETLAITEGYDLATAGPLGELPPGTTVERFQVQRSHARRRIVHAVEDSARERIERAHVPGSSRRNVRVAVLIRGLVTKRLGMPAYVLAYRYRGKLYRVVVSGQDESFVTGAAPYSWLKITLVVLASAFVLALGVFIVSMMMR
jgi:hypothetical protein